MYPWKSSNPSAASLYTSGRTKPAGVLQVTTRLLIALGLLGLGVSPVAAENDELVWLTDLDEAMHEAEKADAYIVVDLYADWCGWCKKLEREVFPAAEFREFAKNKILLHVDVEDGADGSALQARHRAFNLPTTLILDATLARVGQVSGFAPAGALVERFEAEIAAWQRLISRFPQILNQGSAPLQRSLAQELHERGDGGRAAQLYARLVQAAGTVGPEAPWLYYRMADAHRLARDFEAAAETASTARRLAHQGLAGAFPSLPEKIDLLAYQIAQDAGDCQQAKSTLQQYLDSHPGSKNHRLLVRRLEALERGDDAICT
ncbi:MAG: thioredoxin family protein [Thermoanaerobaculia bacterium]|nr:thioredoxin family protein [Thermoanaerobaculia bacterium]